MGSLVQTPLSEVAASLEILAKMGVTTEDLKMFRSASSWEQEKVVQAILTCTRYDFDDSELPSETGEFKVVNHTFSQGQLTWRSTTCELISPKDFSGQFWSEVLKCEQFVGMNATVLDFLMDHQRLIPSSWRQYSVHFPGTVYQNAVGDQFIKYLYWAGYAWETHFSWCGLPIQPGDRIIVHPSEK